LSLRVYVNPDLTGVELCAAAKNVIALAAGGEDGLDLGDNAKAAVITRGLAEMSRLGEACGARPETFAGLAGMGDLIVTCWSRHGRNRAAGELIAQGADPQEAVARIGQTVEGITTAPTLLELSKRVGVELPITDGVCAVLSGQSLGELVARVRRTNQGEIDVAELANGRVVALTRESGKWAPGFAGPHLADATAYRNALAKLEDGSSILGYLSPAAAVRLVRSVPGQLQI